MLQKYLRRFKREWDKKHHTLKAQLPTSETLGFLFPSGGSPTHLFFLMEAVLMQGVEQLNLRDTPMQDESLSL